MPDLTQAQFEIAFGFARPAAAEYRDADGESQSAAANTARFDHDAAGNALGLLVEPGAHLGAADSAVLDELMLPADSIGRDVTVLHVYQPVFAPQFQFPGQQIDLVAAVEYSAYYSRNARATVNALLAAAGHHRSIGVVPGYRANMAEPGQQGFVRYRGKSWVLAPALGATPGFALGDGEGRPLIASS